MNNRVALIPIAGMVLLTLAGCATSPNKTGADNNPITNSTTNTSHAKTVPTTTTNTSQAQSAAASKSTQASVNQTTGSHSQKVNPSNSSYANEIAVIKSKGYSVTAKKPNASVKTASGETLSAWIGILSASQDGYTQFVFFFLNGKYLGTDTAKPSVNITSAKSAGTGSIAVTYPVYKKNDSFAKPTGGADTITYHWNGLKLEPNKPYPKQFS